MLVGKVNKTGNKYDEKIFFAELEKLMYEHGVNKVEAFWGVPEVCHACGSHPTVGGDNTDITHVESGDLDDFEGDVVQPRNGLNKATALGILENVVVKNDDAVSISYKTEMPCDNGITCEMCDCEFPKCNCDQFDVEEDDVDDDDDEDEDDAEDEDDEGAEEDDEDDEEDICEECGEPWIDCLC